MNLIKFANNLEIPVSIIPLYGPDYLDISAIPKELKILAKEKLNEIKNNLSIATFKTQFIPLETFTSDNEKFVYYTFLVTVDNEFVPTLNEEHRGYCWVELKDHPKPLHPGFLELFEYSSITRFSSDSVV